MGAETHRSKARALSWLLGVSSLFLLAMVSCGGSDVATGDVFDPDTIHIDIPSMDKVDHSDGVPESTDTPKPDLDPESLDPDSEIDDTDVPDGSETTPGFCEENGAFGCHCVTGSDCMSGYCVNSAHGKMCTSFCIDECYPGYVCEDISTGGSDPVYICLAAALNVCKPCEKNADCYDFSDNGDRCVDYGNIGAFCGQTCIGDEHCPDGYVCSEVPSIDGKTADQCVPMSGSCECSTYFVDGGFTTACVNANSYGLCTGERHCTDEGLSDCTAAVPEPEVCDLSDNDCDGNVDEGLNEPGSSGCKHVGVCEQDVVATCVNGEWYCAYDEVSNYEPIEQSCDAFDNDCDGQTDEGLTDVAASDCLKVGVCAGLVKAICNGGAWDCDYADVVAYEGSESICDGLDNDCDGVTDEALGGGACTIDNAYGSCPGTAICTIDGSLTCDGPEPASEICDGQDNDCNGELDEGFPDSDDDGKADCVDPDDDNDSVLDDGDSSGSVGDAPCMAGLFSGCDDNCRLTFNPNQADLDGDGKGDVCDADMDGDGDPNVTDCQPENAAVSSKATENCYDLIDNDCDGETDEEGATNCQLFYEDGDQDGVGVLTSLKCLCVAAVPFTATEVGDCNDDEASVKPGLPEQCNGVDEDCDGQTDEGFLNSDTDLLVDCVDPDDDDDTILDDGNGDGDMLDPCAPGESSYCDDNCQFVKNTDQADMDGDGKGDLCDDDIDGDGDPNATDCAPTNPALYHGQIEPCDDVDNDCDGKTDEGEGGANCVVYYKDADGDNHGDPTDSKCLCSPDAIGRYIAETKKDCCDSDANARPGQTVYFTDANECGSFDYNCNDSEEKQYSETGSCGGFGCKWSPGWSGGNPACGIAGNWMNGCTIDWLSCDSHTVTKTQACR